MKDVPEIEREEVRGIFRFWGYEGNELEDLTEHIVKNPKAMLDLMMSYELDFAPLVRLKRVAVPSLSDLPPYLGRSSL